MITGEYQYPLQLQDFSGSVKLLLVAGNQVDKFNTRYELSIQDGELSLRSWTSDPEELVLMLGENGYRNVVNINDDILITTPLGEMFVNIDTIEPHELELNNFTERYITLANGTVMDVSTGKVAWKPPTYISDLGYISINQQYLSYIDYISRQVQVFDLVNGEVIIFPSKYMIDTLLGYDPEHQTVVGIVEEDDLSSQHVVYITTDDSYIVWEDVRKVWYYGSCVVLIPKDEKIIYDICP